MFGETANSFILENDLAMMTVDLNNDLLPLINVSGCVCKPQCTPTQNHNAVPNRVPNRVELYSQAY